MLVAESGGPERVVLSERFVTAYYGDGNAAETSFYVADVPLEDLLAGTVDRGMVAHLNLLWVPKSGATPIDDSATNVGIRVVVIAAGEVGIYGGAGFAIPEGRAGDARMSLALWDATLALQDATDGFVDLLGTARLTGRVSAAHDPQRAAQIGRAVSQLVTNALGRSRVVLSGSPRAPTSPAGIVPPSPGL